jgi:hypothetical protein
MLNDMDRFHLVMDVIDRVPDLGTREVNLREQMVDERLRHRAYTRDHGTDMPDVEGWRWSPASELAPACAVRVGLGSHRPSFRRCSPSTLIVMLAASACALMVGCWRSSLKQ